MLRTVLCWSHTKLCPASGSAKYRCLRCETFFSHRLSKVAQPAMPRHLTPSSTTQHITSGYAISSTVASSSTTMKCRRPRPSKQKIVANAPSHALLITAIISWIWLVILGTLHSQGTLSGNDNGAAGNHFEIYTRLFALKRKEQIQTADQIWNVNDYAKQYKTVQFLMETIFPVLKQSLLDVTEMSFKPGDPFPDEQAQREVLGKIYENILFFGDVLLRVPDITKKIFKQHRQEWKNVLEEAIQFCNASKELFSGPHAIQLHLMAQEIGFIPEEENYVNPFRVSTSHSEVVAEKSNMKGKKRRMKSGPKLRGSKFEL